MVPVGSDQTLLWKRTFSLTGLAPSRLMRNAYASAGRLPATVLLRKVTLRPPFTPKAARMLWPALPIMRLFSTRMSSPSK